MARYSHIDADENDYASVGTPFEALQTAEDVQKAKARKDKDHYVLDEQGRRRFHGAFTGGFSAGYYNTVGSKEGWAPSAFQSSRETRSEFSGQKPEDFMDAEDLGTYGISPREVSTRPNFSQKGAEGLKRQHPPESRPSAIPGEAPLQNLIIPARTSVGARLLRKMGWREGQGVGPRIQKPSTSSGDRVYGCSLPQSSGDPPGPPESKFPPGEVRGFTFAPRDIGGFEFEGKDNHHGIGYRGMQKRAVLGGRETQKSVHGMSGEAFGVGALEEDEVEDHVYGEEAMTSYDVTLAGDGDMEMERKFGWTGGVEDSWSLASFTKATKPRPKPKVYHTPDVPRDFIPIHRFSILNLKTPDTTDSNNRNKPVTAVAERNQLLADKPGSVFSLMSAADRERLKRITSAKSSSAPVSGNNHPAQRKNEPPKPHPPAPPTLSSDASSLSEISVDSIKPFAHNPLKQARYEAFTSGRTLHSDPESIGMTEWERQRERNEFSRTRQVYQPLSVSLSTRFEKEGKEEVGEREKSPEPDSVQAARANMFGVLTRQVLEWHPHRVLCKRFDVPDPYPNDGLVGTVTEQHKQASSTAKHIQFQMQSRPVAVAEARPHHQMKEPALSREDSGPTGGAVSKTDGDAAAARESDAAVGTVTKEQAAPSAKEISESENVPEEARPPPDLFKTIFAESSSESEDEARDSGNPPQEAAANSRTEEPSNKPPPPPPPQRTRWQDLSEVASRPLKVHPGGSGKTEDLAATGSSIAAASREAPLNGDEAVHTSPQKKQGQTFGPSLPPGFGSSGGGELGAGEGEREKREHGGSRHKHKHRHHHHKTSRKEKQLKADDEGEKHKRNRKKHKH